jgi:DNA polymerase III delta prime subunit
MPKCSEEAFEKALTQLSDHAATNVSLSNWMLTYLAAARMHKAGYDFTTLGVDEGVRDLYAVLPTNAARGSINPFVLPTKQNRWRGLVNAGRKTVWNNGTRTNPQRILFNDDHFKNGLRPDAINILLEHLSETTLPGQDALAIFLTRDRTWTAEPTQQELLAAGADYLGLPPADFERITTPQALGLSALLTEPEWSPALLAMSSLAPPKAREQMASSSNPEGVTDEPSPSEPNNESLAWTQGTTIRPLRSADVDALTSRVLATLNDKHIGLPDMETTIRRCVTGLLMGHLILQGPPGTGKTTIARALCEAFEVEYRESTATSEWSPFHVIGGYRPDRNNGFVPVLGTAAEAMIACAKQVRLQAPEDGNAKDLNPDEPQGTWLFIDEFNRADIDKAIGSLYTLLSSCDSGHLDRTPVELWFEHEPSRQKLWSPARFRIIAAMNDLDTGFINAISQGLTRRFQFVTITVPDAVTGPELSPETDNAFTAAHDWLLETYPARAKESYAQTAARLEPELLVIQNIMNGLRYPADKIPGVPIGTAQLLDLLKYVLLDTATSRPPRAVVDTGIADRIIPQMTQIDANQEQTFRKLFMDNDLGQSALALGHLLDPHVV